MNNLEAVYAKLKDDYQVCWNDNKKSFNLYFNYDKSEYQIYVLDDYFEISKKKKIFKYEYWTMISHLHYDNQDDNFENLYKGIIGCIQKYSK